MRHHVLVAGVGLVALAILILAAVARPARADSNDLVMTRLSTVVGSGEDARVVGDNLALRSLASELGVALAPRLLAPADTLGFGGFHFSADMAFTSITDDADYWRVLESSPDPTATAPGMSHGSGFLTTLGLFMRKGMWLPAPSFELGAGAVHLLDSRMWAAQAYAKLALHEGFRTTRLPSIAVRGAVSRPMGSKELVLTIASFDVSVSKAFGLAGAVHVEPYGGWNTLFIVPRSEVMDKTPHVITDRHLHFVFADQDNIIRHRLFTGVKVQHHVFALLFEIDLALAGSSVDDRPGTDEDCADVGMTTEACDSTDRARSQPTYTLSLGLDF